MTSLQLSVNEISILALLLSFGFALFYDLKYHRIPNWLVASTLVSGLAAQVASHGNAGALTSLAGVVVGFASLLPFYLKKAMGAGDVKYMAAVGAHLGFYPALIAVCATLLCGGFIAFIVLGLAGGYREYFSRYSVMLKTLLSTQQIVYLAPAPQSPATDRFPYSSAIVCGSMLALYFSGSLAAFFS
jgi:prepilin peptidase CpaA